MLTFADYVQDRKYIKNVSPKTLSWFNDWWRAFGPHLGPFLSQEKPLKPCIIGAIEALRERGIKPVSINSWLTGVRAFLMWLHAEGQLKEKPTVQLLKFERLVLQTLKPEQVKAFVSHKPKPGNPTRAHVAACVMLDSGLRLTETLSLKKAHLDFDNLVIRVFGKGSKERLVPMSLELRKILFRWTRGKDDELLFGTSVGTKVTSRNFQRDLRALGTEIGITGVRFSPHTLRHSFAIGYLRNGGNLFYLSRILGHTSIRTTERYLQSMGVEDLGAVHDKLSLLGK